MTECIYCHEVGLQNFCCQLTQVRRERDEARAKLAGLDRAATAAQHLASTLANWSHSEDCQKHAHDECGPDESEPEGWYCAGGGLDRAECEPRECECGLENVQILASEILLALSVIPRSADRT